MELWIRSQKRGEIMKVSYLEIDEEGKEKFLIIARNGDPYFDQCLGLYKTKERALEVLDEIQNILKPRLLIRRNDDNDKVLLGALQKGVTQTIDTEYKELSTYVYEMPKE